MDTEEIRRIITEKLYQGDTIGFLLDGIETDVPVNEIDPGSFYIDILEKDLSVDIESKQFHFEDMEISFSAYYSDDDSKINFKAIRPGDGEFEILEDENSIRITNIVIDKFFTSE